MNSFAQYITTIEAPSNVQAQTESLSFLNKNGKKFVLLLEDLKDCLRAIWENGSNIENAFQGDWHYEETKYRNVLGNALSLISSNSVVTNLGSQTLNTVQSLELYAGYLLNKKPHLELDKHTLLKSKNLEPLFSSAMFFSVWLSKNTSLSNKSITSYTGAISGILSDIASIPIFSICTPGKFELIREAITASDEYRKINESGNSMYNAALNHYDNFLTNQSLDPPIPSFNLKALPPICAQHPLAQSLLTKPFVILTGASGTGKTKLAESLAESLRNAEDISEVTNIAIVPVGSDWTDNRNVLGFVNHLRDTGGDNPLPIYQSTPVLDLLLRANEEANKETPHFLILDEMNLSHVERYFSDFLSVMEQKNGELLLHNEASDLPRSADENPASVPSKLPYPPNLFVIGTVNIDETTYMFSPKVLDRANVIEFKVNEEEMGTFLSAPHPYPEVIKAPDGVAEAFLQQAKKARANELDPLTGNAHDEIQNHLLALFNLMQQGRFEFAYRTANEVTRYLRVCRDLATDNTDWETKDWQADLDDQILQKILPKLHGSIGRVGPLLANLADYCHQGKTVDEAKGLKAILELDPEDAEFKKSFTKLQSMIRTLLDEQFVSFIQ